MNKNNDDMRETDRNAGGGVKKVGDGMGTDKKGRGLSEYDQGQLRALGVRLTLCRNSLGHTQAQLAEKMHVTPKTINNYENGRKRPDFLFLREFCRLFKINPNYLLMEVGPSKVFPMGQGSNEDVVGLVDRLHMALKQCSVESVPPQLDDIEKITADTSENFTAFLMTLRNNETLRKQFYMSAHIERVKSS